MRGYCATTYVLFTCHNKVVEGCIFVIGSPREAVGVTDLEMVPAWVCGVKVTNNQERQTEGSAFGVADTLYNWELGIIDITFILDADHVFEGEVRRRLKRGYYFVGL